MKHKISFVAALWWVILCAMAGIFLLITAERQPRLSETENRMLAGFPEMNAASIVSGSFMENFEMYLTDGFFDRDGVISLTDRMMDRFSMLSKDDKMLVQAQDMENRLQIEGENQAADAAPSETAAPAPAQPDPDTAAVMETDDPGEEETADLPDGAYPMTDENSYLWLKRTDGTNKILYTYENSKIATYAETLRIIQTYLPGDGQIFVTQVPLASIGNRWTDQQDTYCGWGSSVETVLERALQGTDRIHIFNTWEILEPYMTGDTPLFYHTDHHWSAEGAYIVAAEMLKSRNLPVIPYDEYEYAHIRSKKDDEGHVDTFNVLYPLFPANSYLIENVTKVTEIDLMNYRSSSYLAYMNNSRKQWRRIVSGCNTGRKALVICDSFGNAFTPYLLAYYDEVHMIDFRYGYYDESLIGGSIGDMVTRYGIDDIYLIFSTANGLRKDNSIVYLRQYFVG